MRQLQPPLPEVQELSSPHQLLALLSVQERLHEARCAPGSVSWREEERVLQEAEEQCLRR